MPIVGEGNNVHVEYKIPDDIKSRIPEYFYYAMAGELVSVMGASVLDLLEVPLECSDGTEDYDYYYDLHNSTSGWGMAFKMTCYKLDMMWLVDYWNTLEWYDSDIFDGEIEWEIIGLIKNGKIECNGANDYYKYLLKKFERCN